MLLKTCEYENYVFIVCDILDESFKIWTSINH